MAGRSRLRRSRRQTVVERAGLTEEAVDALRERGLLSRVVRLPAPAPGISAPVGGVPPAPPPSLAPAPSPSLAPALPPSLAPAPSPWTPPPPVTAADPRPRTDPRQPAESATLASPRQTSKLADPRLPADPQHPGEPATPADPRLPADPHRPAESTVLRPRRHDLVLDDGRRAPLTAAGLVVGRRRSSVLPEADPHSPASPTPRLEIDDPQRSLSRDHARLDVGDDGVVLVVDLGSANGTTVHSLDGSVTELVPGRPLAVHAGDALHLGDTVAHLQRSEPRRRAVVSDTAPPGLAPAEPSGGA